MAQDDLLRFLRVVRTTRVVVVVVDYHYQSYIYIYIYGVFIHSCLMQNFLMVVVDGGVGLQKCNLLLV